MTIAGLLGKFIDTGKTASEWLKGLLISSRVLKANLLAATN